MNFDSKKDSSVCACIILHCSDQKVMAKQMLNSSVICCNMKPSEASSILETTSCSNKSKGKSIGFARVCVHPYKAHEMDQQTSLHTQRSYFAENKPEFTGVTQEKVRDEQKMQTRYYSNTDDSFKQRPLPLLMITFSGLSEKDESFWIKLAPFFFFFEEKIPEGMTFYDRGANEPSFFILESGLVRSVFKFESE